MTNGELFLRETFDALNTGDVDTCRQRLAADFEMHHAGEETVRGREVWVEGARLMLGAFADFRVTLLDVVAAGELVAIRARLTGTHTGDWFGLPASGRTVDYVSHEFYRYEGGLLTAEWICSDIATMTRQLGVA